MHTDLEYSIGEVAAMLGVSPHTIRAWERRHGILSPSRTRSRHRRYRDADIEVLREVKRAVEIEGLSLKLAYQSATSGLARASGTPATRTGERRIRSEAGSNPWRAVADLLQHLMLLVDRNGRIVDANSAVAKTSGMLRQRLEAKPFADLIDPYDREKAVLMYKPAIRARSGWELNVLTPAGTSLFSFDSWPIRTPEDSLLAIVGRELRGHELSSTPTLPAGEVMTELGSTMAMETLISMLDQVHLGVAIISTGKEPRIAQANEQASATIGVTRDHLLGRRVADLLAPEAAATISEIREATEQRRRVSIQGVAARRRAAKEPASILTLTLYPLVSMEGVVTSALLVLEPEETAAPPRPARRN